MLFRTFSALESIFLPFSAAIWSFQLIVDAFLSEKAVGSFREDRFLEESLSVNILEAVGVLGSEPILFSSLSPEEDEDKASEEGFFEIEEAETLLEECLTM